MGKGGAGKFVKKNGKMGKKDTEKLVKKKAGK
jgi:hypothetical protein